MSDGIRLSRRRIHLKLRERFLRMHPLVRICDRRGRNSHRSRRTTEAVARESFLPWRHRLKAPLLHKVPRESGLPRILPKRANPERVSVLLMKCECCLLDITTVLRCSQMQRIVKLNICRDHDSKGVPTLECLSRTTTPLLSVKEDRSLVKLRRLKRAPFSLTNRTLSL